MKSKQRNEQVSVLTDSQFKKELRAFVQICWQILSSEYDNVNQIADAAGLSWQTVHNLVSGSTKNPKYKTILKLARAARLSLVFSKSGPRVRLVG